MSNVTITFHAQGRDYAVDFPDESSAREWFQDSNPLDSTVAERITKEQADAILFRESEQFNED